MHPCLPMIMIASSSNLHPFVCSLPHSLSMFNPSNHHIPPHTALFHAISKDQPLSFSMPGLSYNFIHFLMLPYCTRLHSHYLCFLVSISCHVLFICHILQHSFTFLRRRGARWWCLDVVVVVSCCCFYRCFCLVVAVVALGVVVGGWG